jgi:PKD repeat protein
VELEHGRNRGRFALGATGRWVKATVAFATSAALTIAGLAFTAAPASADTHPPAGIQETVTSVPLPTAQINGVAWTQAIVGNTVWVGGEFTNARPAGAAPGVNTSPRANLMAYTLSTGVMTSWNPGANGSIRAIVASPDGSRIYVAGNFTTIAGASRNRIAAFSTATGALLSWNPGANNLVADVAAAGNTVWLVGNFSSVAGGTRPRIAAVSASTGALLPLTANVVGGNGIRAIEVNPTGDKVVIGGSFESTNGQTNPGRGLAALDAVTGASMEWKVNSIVRNGGTNAAIYGLASDGDSVYGVGYDFFGGEEDNFEGTFRASWTDGSLVWLEHCHGDNYSVAVGHGVVYTTAHDHYCGNIGGYPQTQPWTFKHALAFDREYRGNQFTMNPYGYRSFVGEPAATLLHWYPDWQVGTYTGKQQAGWAVEANDQYVVYGGEFPAINGVAQEGLVRFGKKSVAADGSPQFSGSQWAVTALSLRPGEMRLSWPANTDRDNKTLTYELFRQDQGATPIWSGTADSTFWDRPDMKYVDKTVTAGTTYQYRVRATDPNGNVATGAWVSVTATTTPASDYALGVLDDGAEDYWPLGETSGTAAANWADGGDLTVNSATRGVTGQNLATTSRATAFSGSSSSFAVTRSAEPGPDLFSVEAWFKTTSTDGGKIIGFGNSATGNSGNYDRHLYIDGAGRVTWGVHPGGVRVVQSGTGYNDGVWHHVVGTLGPDGMTLYVDGKRAGSRADTTSGQPYSGYWRIGGDNLNGWPNVGGSHYLNGSIADVAVYPSVLTRAQVNEHWMNSGRASALPTAPVDAYGKAVFDLWPTLYWRLNDTGPTVADAGPDSVAGTFYGDVTKGVAGALFGVADAAIRTNPSGGTQTGVASNVAFANPTVFAEELWFKTDSTSGGKILGFGNSQTGGSSGYDRHVYMSGNGRVKFGVWTGQENVVQSAPGFNDNQWHHVVAQISSAGMQLFVDGELVATSANTQSQNYVGYWRVGGDNGWEGDQYWRGTVDEVAIYPTTLTAKQVGDHYDLGMVGVANTAPTASFSSIATELSVAFDGTSSSDVEGPIASYAWDFGDGGTSAEATPNHVFPHSGTWDVTLTVTDGQGDSSSITQPVEVTGPNVDPTSSFMTATKHLAVTFDGTASADVDGTIESYAWAFGDGTTGTGETASHTYSAAGTYTVSLTVTDDRGGSAYSEQTVTTTAPPGLPGDVYGAAVYNLSPTLYWRFDETSGSTVHDAGVEDNPGAYFGNLTKGVTGALATGTGSAIQTHPNGNDQTGAVSDRRFTNPTSFSLETWFKTDTTSGGKIAGFGITREGMSTNYDRHVYMAGDGTVRFGVWTGSAQIISSGAGYNDNQWHHVVAQMSSSGMQLYLDGQIVASSPNTAAENYNGYWRVGGDSGWEGDAYWRGSIDEFAVYPAPLTGDQVDDHYELGKFGFVNEPPTAAFSSVVTDQTVAFDGTSSSDLDGPIALYEWAFGDGATGTGATVSHDYGAPGSYDVILTVTDGQGMTDSVTHTVVATAPNQAPTAAFTTDVDDLLLTVDGTGSNDPDGTIASYVWAFGDGTTKTTTTPTTTHTYAAGGTYDVSLTVKDDDGASSTTLTKQVEAEAPNVPPVAAFTSEVEDLEVTVDASASSDTEGPIASYAWTFGDGGTATGVTASHSYAAPGTYTVKLTVTDEDGATHEKTAQVTATLPPGSGVLATDGFERTVASGWGTADQGGAWSITGTAARFSVADGAGSITLTNSVTQQASLGAVSSVNTRVAASFSVDKIANAQYISVIGRQVGADQYILRVRVATDGSVQLNMLRNGTAVGAGVTAPGVTIVPGAVYQVVFQVTGTAPTALNGKIWKATDPEPAGFQLTRSDATAVLQAPGSVGVSSYVPAAANAYPLKLSFPEITITDPTIQ